MAQLLSMFRKALIYQYERYFYSDLSQSVAAGFVRFYRHNSPWKHIRPYTNLFPCKLYAYHPSIFNMNV